MKIEEFKRVLLIRLDRIGDLVLSLPVDQAFAESEIQWWIPRGLSFVTQNASPPRKAREVNRQTTWSEFFTLLRDVRQARFDAAVVFHAPWWVGLLLWLARVPVRAGVKSQWHSFLFFNRAVRQKRSTAEHSELEYNFRLLEEALRKPVGSLDRTTLHLKGSHAEQTLAKHTLLRGQYSVVHPGMGGSALNWPTDYYETLIRTLSKNETVVITGTAADENYLAPLRERLKDTERVVWLDKRLNGQELITVLSCARTITAPSTGVLHLAASTGQPTLGLFSPVRVQQPRRWGPQGARTAALMPEGGCPTESLCSGTKCDRGDCMSRIKPEQVIQALAQLAP